MEYFVYRHIRLDTNEVFYIGIGKKIENYNSFKSEYRRAFSKRRNKYWKNIVNKTEYEIEIMYECEDFKFIKDKEREFIESYGRKDKNKGTLVNYTDGGEGTVGYVFTKEQLDKLSKSHIGNSNPHKGKSYEEAYGKDKAEEWKNNFKEIRKGTHLGEKNPSFGKKHSLESKIKMGTPVLQYDLDGNFIREFYSITEASTMTNSLSSLIQKVCKGERNKHNNFIWKYKDINNTRI